MYILHNQYLIIYCTFQVKPILSFSIALTIVFAVGSIKCIYKSFLDEMTS